MEIINRSILITGANRGIGKALVYEALRRGAKRIFAGMRSVSPSSDPRVVPVILDVTSDESVRLAAQQIDSLDILINNAGIARYEDLSDLDIVRDHLEVNLFGILRMTNAFRPLLAEAKGALANNLSVVALGPVPLIPAYSLSKAAGLNLTQSLRTLLRLEEITVHGVLIGPTDTDMNRDFPIPKVSPESVAYEIFEGLQRGEEEIFPDPVSSSLAEGWRNGIAKSVEKQSSRFLPGWNAAE